MWALITATCRNRSLMTLLQSLQHDMPMSAGRQTCQSPTVMGPLTIIVGAGTILPLSYETHSVPRLDSDPGFLITSERTIRESVCSRGWLLGNTYTVTVTPWMCCTIKELLSFSVDQGWAGECQTLISVSFRDLSYHHHLAFLSAKDP